jgi:hypothetical protein
VRTNRKSINFQRFLGQFSFFLWSKKPNARVEFLAVSQVQTAFAAEKKVLKRMAFR